MIKAVDNGYGYPTSGGVPEQPANQWIPSVQSQNGGQGPYAFSHRRHVPLTSHGWSEVGGVMTCEKPGTAPTSAAPASPRAPSSRSRWTTQPASRPSRRRWPTTSRTPPRRASSSTWCRSRSTRSSARPRPCAVGPKCNWDMPQLRWLELQRPRLRADRRAALRDRRRVQRGQLLRPQRGQADQRDPHQQQHRRCSTSTRRTPLSSCRSSGCRTRTPSRQPPQAGRRRLQPARRLPPRVLVLHQVVRRPAVIAGQPRPRPRPTTGGAAADARKDKETVVGFLIRRTGQAIFVLFLVTVATLGLVHLFPAARSARSSAFGRRPSRSPTTTTCTASTSRSTCSTSSGWASCCTATSGSRPTEPQRSPA